MNILKVRKDANSPWETIDALVGPVGPVGPQGDDYVLTDADKREIAGYINLSSYATIKYVDNKVAAIPTPDYSNYYTKSQTDTKIQEAVAAIPGTDLTDYATTEYVSQKIAEAQLGGSEVDLSAYYTKSEVEAKGYQTEDQVKALVQTSLPASGEEVYY